MKYLGKMRSFRSNSELWKKKQKKIELINQIIVYSFAQRSRIAMYISLHSYSQMWLLPWGFAEARPEDFSDL